MGLNELKDMGRIIGISLFYQLTMIEAINKKLNGAFQPLNTGGKTPRTTT
jgi:hypothetical protein